VDPYTAKNVIGNRLFRLKSASLLMQNTTSSIGIFLTTHSVLLYIVNSKKNFPTVLMGENPWYLMETAPLVFVGKCRQFLRKF
jgi:hypothetical protein